MTEKFVSPMHVDMCIHGCTRFRVVRHFPDINNAIALRVVTDSGEFDLTMYGLPRAVTTLLLASFSDDRTDIFLGTTGEELRHATA